MGKNVGHLCDVHRAVSEMYAGNTGELSPAQVDAYRRDGFVGPMRLLDERQVGVVRDTLEKMLEPDYPRAQELIGRPELKGERKGVIYFQGAWGAEESFHDLLWMPRLMKALSQLLEVERVRFFHDQVFYKPPRHGGVVAWHQDYSYWTRTTPPGHITCFVALDDTNLENGCLHLVPGSHRWNLLPKVPLTGTNKEDMDSIRAVMSPQQLAEFKPVPMILKAGECSFHHYYTLHGSYANNSERPRRSLVLNFMRADTRSDSDEPLMPGAEVVAKGSVVEGAMFPVVRG